LRAWSDGDSGAANFERFATSLSQSQ